MKPKLKGLGKPKETERLTMINVSHMEVNELDDSNAEMINNQNDQTNVSIEKEAEEGEE